MSTLGKPHYFKLNTQIMIESKCFLVTCGLISKQLNVTSNKYVFLICFISVSKVLSVQSNLIAVVPRRAVEIKGLYIEIRKALDCWSCDGAHTHICNYLCVYMFIFL